jgi:hypothetical protein
MALRKKKKKKKNRKDALSTKEMRNTGQAEGAGRRGGRR